MKLLTFINKMTTKRVIKKIINIPFDGSKNMHFPPVDMAQSALTRSNILRHNDERSSLHEADENR